MLVVVSRLWGDLETLLDGNSIVHMLRFQGFSFEYRCQCRLLVAVIGGCQIALAMHVSPVLDSNEWESCILFSLTS